MLYPGGGRREYDDDPLMRITRILAKDPGKNIVLDYSYSYDNMDNILSKQTGQGTYDYTYDALYRLTDVQVDIPGQANEGFSYDAVGNRLTEEGVEGEWTYNDNNELLTFATTEYTYDANGNTTQLLLDGTVLFTYHDNAQDRLVKVDDVNGSTIGEYAYDPFGRRLWKDVGGNRIYFFYADEGLVAEYDVSGTEIRSYGYRPDSTWTTDPLWLKHGGEYYFYQNDHLGTPQKLVAQNGSIVWSAQYRAFGQANVEIETITNNLRFPGQYFDEETGWHYNWYRYYASGIGRYITEDPIHSIHVYTYCINNPIIFFDVYGLFHYGTIQVKGHKHFTGSIEKERNPCYFDYNLEDIDPRTSPLNYPEGTKRHFRSLSDFGPDGGIEKDLKVDISMCFKEVFQRHMHQGQDDFTHYKKGYRWQLLDPSKLTVLSRRNGVIVILVPGHAGPTALGINDPDDDEVAWNEAEQWTKDLVNQWERNCCCKGGKWERK